MKLYNKRFHLVAFGCGRGREGQERFPEKVKAELRFKE